MGADDSTIENLLNALTRTRSYPMVLEKVNAALEEDDLILNVEGLTDLLNKAEDKEILENVVGRLTELVILVKNKPPRTFADLKSVREANKHIHYFRYSCRTRGQFGAIFDIRETMNKRCYSAYCALREALGRPPKTREMDAPNSTIKYYTISNRFGGIDRMLEKYEGSTVRGSDTHIKELLASLAGTQTYRSILEEANELLYPHNVVLRVETLAPKLAEVGKMKNGDVFLERIVERLAGLVIEAKNNPLAVIADLIKQPPASTYVTYLRQGKLNAGVKDIFDMRETLRRRYYRIFCNMRKELGRKPTYKEINAADNDLTRRKIEDRFESIKRMLVKYEGKPKNQ